MVESKKLDEPQGERLSIKASCTVLTQVPITSCLPTAGAMNYMSLAKPLRSIISFDFDIRFFQETAVVCLKALALWRQSVQAGHAVAGQKSIFGPLEDTSVPPEKEATVDPPPPPPPPPPADWEPLTEITEATGRKVAEMVFPDGSRTPLRNWSFLPVEAVRWLMANGMLTAGECPIVQAVRVVQVTWFIPNQSMETGFVPSSAVK